MTAPAEPSTTTRPRHVAVIIGIADYVEPRLRLDTPVRDARALASLLATRYGYAVTLVCDRDATRRGLEQLFHDRLPELVDDETAVIVYFAGHGAAVDSVDRPRGYFAPVDAGSEVATLLDMADVATALDRLPCKHVLVILDCCFAGAFRWSAGRDVTVELPTMYRQRYERYLATRAWQVITSAAYDEQAADVVAGFAVGKRDVGAVSGSSPFLAALLAGLGGEADFFPANAGRAPGDGVITASELYLYLRGALESSDHRQTPGLWTLPKHEKGEYIFLIGDPERLPSAPELSRQTSPYRGFEVYEEEHAPLFHGRTAAIVELLARVEANPITVVVGSSGTGKSSLARAGLVPAIRKRHADWQILPPLRPGATPLATLDALLAMRSPSSTALLLIDQMEELFASPDRPDERHAFLARVAELAAGNVRVVGTLRADLETELWTSPLAVDWKAVRFPIGDMTRAELREAIELPAEQKVLTFDPPALVERLVDTVVSMPGALPLLSFTLDKMYVDCLARASGDRRLLEPESGQTGGIATALREHAEQLYDGFDPATRATMDRVLLRMVELKGGSIARRQVPKAEFSFADDDEQRRIDRVLEALRGEGEAAGGAMEHVGMRLAVLGSNDDGAFYELAHDAVARDWPRFRALLREARPTDLVLRRAVTDAAARWTRERGHAGYLWRDDPRLAEASARLATTPQLLNRIETAFLAESRRARRRRTRAIVATAASFVTVAAVLSSLAWQQSVREAESRKRADDNALAELGMQATSLAQQPGREVEALVLAVQATARALESGRPVPRSVAIGLAAAVATPAHPLATLTSDATSAVFSIATARSGSHVLTAGGGGDSQLWDASTGALLDTFQDEPGHEGAFAELSPDGARFVTVGKDRTPKLWTIATRQRIELTEAGHASTAHFSPDGTRIVTGGPDGVPRLWHATTGALVARFAASAPIIRSAFAPDGRSFVTTSVDGSARLWSVSGGPPLSSFALAPTSTQRPDAISAVAISPGGTHLVLADIKGHAALWNLATRARIRDLDGHSQWVGTAAFSSDGVHILTVSHDATAVVWRVDGARRVVLTGHKGNVCAGAFSPDGTRVLTGGADQTARIWDAESGTPIAVLRGNPGLVSSVAFSADGTTAVAASDKGANVWAISSDALPVPLRGHRGPVVSAEFAPGGATVATAGMDGTARIWDSATGALRQSLAHDAAVRTVAFSRDGGRLLTTSGHVAQIWSTQTWTSIVRRVASAEIEQGALAPDGERFVVALSDAPVHVYDAAGAAIPLDGKTDMSPSFVRFAADGRRILAGTIGSDLRIFDLGERSERGVQLPVVGTLSVAFSPDGEYVVTSHMNHEALVSTKDLTRNKWILSGHTDTLYDAEYSQDGARIVTAGADHTIRVWETERGTQLFSIGGIAGNVISVRFSPDGTRIVAAGSDGAAIYPVSMPALLPLACKLLRYRAEVRSQAEHACAASWRSR